MLYNLFVRMQSIKSNYGSISVEVIVQTSAARDPLTCPAVLGSSHGPFAWGRSVQDAVHNAVVLEHVIRLAGETFRISPSPRSMQQPLLNKHFFRKHGPGAYYGQGSAAKHTRSSNHK